MLSKSIGFGSAAALVLLASIVASNPAAAMPQYAGETGKACGACHVKPSGGGTLTSAGKEFKLQKDKGASATDKGTSATDKETSATDKGTSATDKVAPATDKETPPKEK